MIRWPTKAKIQPEISEQGWQRVARYRQRFRLPNVSQPCKEVSKEAWKSIEGHKRLEAESFSHFVSILLPWFLQAGVTQYSSKVMAAPLPAERIRLDNAAFHPSVKDWHTPRLLQAGVILLFFEAMVRLSFAEATRMDNATFRPWRRGSHISRFQQESTIQCFFEVMALLLSVEIIALDSATFQLQRRATHMFRFLCRPRLHHASHQRWRSVTSRTNGSLCLLDRAGLRS